MDPLEGVEEEEQEPRLKRRQLLLNEDEDEDSLLFSISGEDRGARLSTGDDDLHEFLNAPLMLVASTIASIDTQLAAESGTIIQVLAAKHQVFMRVFRE